MEGRRKTLAGVNGQYQVQPIHIYDELRPKPYHDNPTPQEREVNASALYLTIKTTAAPRACMVPSIPKLRSSSIANSRNS